MYICIFDITTTDQRTHICMLIGVTVIIHVDVILRLVMLLQTAVFVFWFLFYSRSHSDL